MNPHAPSCMSLHGSLHDTLKILTNLFNEDPKVIPRPVGGMIISKAGKVVVKIFEESIIHQFYGETDFTSFVAKHKDRLDCTLPLLGSVIFRKGEFLELVGKHRAPQTHRDMVAMLKNPEEETGETEGPGWKTEGGFGEAVKLLMKDENRFVGVLVMEYLPDSFSLTEYIIQRRHIQEHIYEAELCYIFSKVLAFVATLQQISPSAKHHDLKPDNILIQWDPKPSKIPLRSWKKEILFTEPLPQRKDGEDEADFPDIKPRVYSIIRPPDFTLKVIDYGLGWRPEGYSRHIADKMVAMYGVCPAHNPHYDLHTFVNGMRDMLLHRPEISDRGIYRCEKILLGAVSSVFGEHVLGFGMAISTNFMASGRGIIPGIFPIEKGPQPLVQTRISSLPRILKIFPGEQEAQVQAAFVVLLSRRDSEGLKKMVSSQCPPEIMDDLLSENPERILFASAFFNLNCLDLPSPLTILLDNLFNIKGLHIS